MNLNSRRAYPVLIKNVRTKILVSREIMNINLKKNCGAFFTYLFLHTAFEMSSNVANGWIWTEG